MRAEHRLVKVQLPIGEKHDFKGVIDLISMKAYLGDGKTAVGNPGRHAGCGKGSTRRPGGSCGRGRRYLLEKYLENGSLSDEELIRGLRDVSTREPLSRSFARQADTRSASCRLLNGIIDLLPSPAQAKARVAQGQRRRGNAEGVG